MVSSALVLGALLGVAGTFAPASVRPLLWGLDGTALVLGAAMLAVHHLRRGDDLAAAGLLVFLAGQTLVLAVAAMDLTTSGPVFTSGVVLWAAALVVVGLSDVMPSWVRLVGFVAALLFAITAVQSLVGPLRTPLSRPLPFFAYPFLAATLFGWAWAHLAGRTDS